MELSAASSVNAVNFVGSATVAHTLYGTQNDGQSVHYKTWPDARYAMALVYQAGLQINSEASNEMKYTTTCGTSEYQACIPRRSTESIFGCSLCSRASWRETGRGCLTIPTSTQAAQKIAYGLDVY